MDSRGLVLFLQGAGSLGIMIALIHVIGVYGAMLPFLLVSTSAYWAGIRGLKTLSIAFMTPVVTFVFFEVALKITLPKGYTEPLFYPIYDLVY